MPSLDPKSLNERLGKIKGTLAPRGAKNTLSVCMIVKNEESMLHRCLKSVMPVADEIIINDT